MDFSLFAHMERITPDQNHVNLREELIQLAKIADEGGMRAIWTGEHHGMDFTIAPNPFISLVDLSYHTKNLRLGTGTIIAPFWHPIKLAGEAAASDLITGGRIELGIARGAYSYEYERLVPGMDALEAGKKMRESIPLLRKLWSGDCEHSGKYYNFPKTSSAPKPLQKDGPPIWIAARDINSHKFGVENGFNIQVTPLWMGNDEIEDLMKKFKEACNDYKGKRPKIMLLHHTYVGSDEHDVHMASKQLSKFYCYFGAWFQNKRPVNQGHIKTLSQDELDANEMMSPKNMDRNLTIGTSKSVIKQIKKFEDLGYDEYAFWIDSGMEFKKKKESLERFINEVMPAFN